jgi:predicted nucleic acid-binding Zn ribbon protein
MPRYTYKCDNEKCEKCNLIIEQIRTVDDRNKEENCECGQLLQRVPETTAPPLFRGEGFTPRFHK